MCRSPFRSDYRRTHSLKTGRSRTALTFDCPTADGLIENLDLAFEKHLFDKAKAEWKSDIETDSEGYDLRREAMALIVQQNSFVV
jgi:hypothetical protein